MATEPSTTSTAARIECEICNSPNFGDKKYCGFCGSRLWQPCYSCQSRNAVNETFCGNCGQNVKEQFIETKAGIKQQLKIAEELKAANKFLEAISVLKAISDCGDTRLEKYAAAAEELLNSVSILRKQKESTLDELYDNATRELSAHNYSAAAKWMEQIPHGMRNGQMRQTAETIEQRISEIKALSKQVREGLAAKSFDTLLPIVERLCELKGDDPHLKSLREKLRARFTSSQIQAAKTRLRRVVQLLSADSFSDASAELQHISDGNDYGETLQQTIDQAREICWLYRELKDTPFATPQSVALLKRFKRLRPNSKTCKQFAALIEKNLEANPKDRRQLIKPLYAVRSSTLDLPVIWWNGFASCIVDPPAHDVIQRHSGRFAVAYGLALQGIRVAKIETNLLFDLGQSVLQKLSNRRPRITGHDAWGIDVGATALKAIRLIREKTDGDVQLATAIVVPHATPLNPTLNDEQRSEIIADSLQRLTEEIDEEKVQAIIGISAPKTLGRFFSIPALKPKKLTDAIRFEAKHQIPLPDEEVVYDHHSWPVESGMNEVALIAAQRDQVRPLLEAFQDTSIQVVAVQSACVALYNACHREFLWKPTDVDESANTNESKRKQMIAVLDVGAESSIFSLVSDQGIRFRNLPFGTFRLTQMLSSEFGCNLTRAEAMRTRIESNSWLYKVDDALANGFADLNNDTARTLDNMASDLGKPNQLIVTGGGTNQHGVIRSIIHRRDEEPIST